MDWSSWGPAGHDDLTRRPARTVPDVPATPGTVVEDVASGFTGAVIGIERSGVGFLFMSRDQEQFGDIWNVIKAMGAGKAAAKAMDEYIRNK